MGRFFNWVIFLVNRPLRPWDQLYLRDLEDPHLEWEQDLLLLIGRRIWICEI